MTRRSFLISLVSLISLLSSAGRSLSQSLPGVTDEEILRGLLDALIPSDDTPGAKEANLYEKLSVLISQNRKLKKSYDDGIAMVRKEVEKSGGKQIDWDAILKKISPSPFFSKLKLDAMAVFYTDPVGWEVIGYEGPPLTAYLDYHRCE